MKNLKTDRKRYVFSMITAVLLVGTLIVGSIGGIVQVAAARDNYSSRNYNYHSPGTNQNRGNGSPNNRPQPKQSTPTKTTPSSSKTVAPPQTKTPPAAQPATTTSAPTVTQSAPKAEAPVTSTPQIVAQPPAPKLADTASAITSMTEAQADKSTQPVSYTSGRLSDDTRNRILIMAGIAAVTGGLLYTISFIGAAAPAVSKREIPIRYIVPVREVVTS